MQQVEPEVYLIAATEMKQAPLDKYLETIGAPEWDSDAPTDAEKLVEFMGRQCYRSFKPGLNPNVQRVREGNDTYLGHIIDVGHGSVLEHVQLSFVFHNVSRVFTHELVRHRVGVAISQESLRYVRLDNLRMWFPPCIANDIDARQHGMDLVNEMERFQTWLANHYKIDELPMAEKKRLTSAFRRFAPIGLATSIGWSANIRTLRHVIEQRTAQVAEVEIRRVFNKVALLAGEAFPNFFDDFMQRPDEDGELSSWIPGTSKV